MTHSTRMASDLVELMVDSILVLFFFFYNKFRIVVVVVDASFYM